jgi:hypothetical protein
VEAHGEWGRFPARTRICRTSSCRPTGRGARAREFFDALFKELGPAAGRRVEEIVEQERSCTAESDSRRVRPAA